MSRVYHTLLILLVAGAVLAGSGCQIEEEPIAAAELPTEADEVVTVEVLQPERMDLVRSTTQPATVHADFQAELYEKVAGYLDTLNADIGDEVEKGQILGVVDLPEVSKSIERQEATIRRLRADERRAEAGIELAKADVAAAQAAQEQAKADVAQEEAILTAARAEMNRTEGLVSDRAVTGQVLDEARKRFESAQAGKSSAEAALTTAKANVLVSQAKQVAAEADLDTAKAQTAVAEKEREELEVQLAYATIKAPFAGTVTQRNVDPGDLVRNIQTSSVSGQAPLFVVEKLDLRPGPGGLAGKRRPGGRCW